MRRYAINIKRRHHASPKARGVYYDIRVVRVRGNLTVGEWINCHYGRTERGQYQVAMVEAQRLCERMNATGGLGVVR